MKPERAEEILKTIKQRGGSVLVGRDLTPAEDSEVIAMWNKLPHGTCYYDAVRRLAEGDENKRTKTKQGIIKAMHVDDRDLVLYIETDKRVGRFFGRAAGGIVALGEILGRDIVMADGTLDESKIVGQNVGYFASDDGTLLYLDRAQREHAMGDQENRGTIKKITLQGGIAILTIEAGGVVKRYYGDNGPTVRALASALGPGVIAPGHLLDESKVVGQEIGFEVEGEMLTSIWS